MRSRKEWLAIEAAIQGLTRRQVMEKLGCTYAQAYQIMCRVQAKDYPPEGFPRKHRLPVNGMDIGRHEYRPSEIYIPVLKAMCNNTLEEVGQRLGITRERVRQLYIEHRLDRLKHGPWREGFLFHRITKEMLLPYTDGTRTQLEAMTELRTNPNSLKRAAQHHGVKLKFKFQLAQELFAAGQQRCSQCHQIQPLSEFSPNGRKGRGLHTRCKSCSAADAKQWYESHKHSISVLMLGRKYLTETHEWSGKLADALLFTRSQRTNTRLYWFPDGARFRFVTEEIKNLLTPEELNRKLSPRGTILTEIGKGGADPVSTFRTGEGQATVAPGDCPPERPVTSQGAAHQPTAQLA